MNVLKNKLKNGRLRLLLLTVAVGLLASAVFSERISAAVRVVVECDELTGLAGIYPCEEVDLMSVVATTTLSAGGTGNDSWGWTDPLTGREYAIMGHSLGTTFTDITDPENPIYMGYLPSGSTINALWRDMEVYQNHVYTVGDFSPTLQHGLQIFDLTELRNPPPLTGQYTETARYMGFDEAHNFAVNVDTGYGYAVGSEVCSGGLEILDLSDPVNPVQAGCFDEDGYTHDVQCVVYTGPDADHQGSEICLAANEDTLTVVDVTDKSNPTMLSRETYAGYGYSHQGWLTEDQAYFLLGDELDEQNNGHNTRTYIWDVRDLDNIALIDFHEFSTQTIDHNLYIHGGLAFEANYNDGLRILDLTNIADGELKEVAFFDTLPGVSVNQFAGSWNVYPFYESGNVIVSNLEEGLYVLRYTLPNLRATMTASHDEPVPDRNDIVTYDIDVTNIGNVDATGVEVVVVINGVEVAASGPDTIGVDQTESYQLDFRIRKEFCPQLSAHALVSTNEEVGARTNIPIDTTLACVPTAVQLGAQSANASVTTSDVVVVSLLLLLSGATLWLPIRSRQ